MKAVYDYVPIYNRDVFYGTDAEAIKKEVLKYYRKESIDLGFIHDSPGFGWVAPIPDKEDDEIIRAFALCVKDPEDIDTLTHEVTHLKNFIFDYIGQELDLVNDEAESYLMGYLMARFQYLINGKAPVSAKPKRKLRNVKR